MLSPGISPTMRPPRLNQFEDCNDSDEEDHGMLQQFEVELVEDEEEGDKMEVLSPMLPQIHNSDD